MGGIEESPNVIVLNRLQPRFPMDWRRKYHASIHLCRCLLVAYCVCEMNRNEGFLLAASPLTDHVVLEPAGDVPFGTNRVLNLTLDHGGLEPTGGTGEA